MWFFTFFSCIHFIYKILSCVLFCAAIWVSKEHKYNSKPLSLFVHNNVKCTYLQSSALLFFLGEIGFTWRLLQKISSYWYRKSWIGKPLPLCIVVPSLPKALLLLLGRFLLLMLLLPFLVKKNMIMQYLLTYPHHSSEIRISCLDKNVQNLSHLFLENFFYFVSCERVLCLMKCFYICHNYSVDFVKYHKCS